ncbi:MAG: BatA and WFA domain-containing protein, partial [Ignavibacteriales bacterium]|nr:BatA and WFA domain-containing protein [Ignavibacteriales bacterium]
MIFLNPLVLFGLIATSIPVLIHLLNLKKLKKIEFSTLAFLKELQKSKIRKIKLKQWILLALRILIIAFLVMSFARPTLKTISLGGTSSVAKTTAILILDDSFSMSVISEKGSYFNQAKQVIKTIISELQEGDEIALLKTSDRNDREIILTNNFSNVIKDLNDSEIKDRSGTLHNAILKAGMLLSQSKNFNKEIYIFSDYQKSRMFEEESQLSDLKDLFTEDTRLYNFKYTEKDVFNIAITDFKINNQIFQKNATLDFSATVKNESERTVSNGVISLFINGERKAQQSFNLNSNESNEINFEITLQNEGLLEVMTEIEDDDILNDNRRYLSLYIPEFINVLIFVDEDSDAEL